MAHVKLRDLVESGDALIIRPTVRLSRERPQSRSASTLTVCWESAECTQHDFYTTSLPNFLEKAPQPLMEELLGVLPQKCADECCSCRWLLLHAAKCQGRVADCLNRLRERTPFMLPGIEDPQRKMRNEHVFNEALGEPIIDMICDVGKFKARRVERVEGNMGHSGPAPSRSSSMQPPSSPPKFNYSLYTIRQNDDIIAILIETKVEDRANQAIAQVMGYHCSFLSEHGSPPLVFVLTEKFIRVLLFPFHLPVIEGGAELMTAIQLPSLPIWVGEGEDGLMNLGNLMLLGMLALHRPSCSVVYPFEDGHQQKKTILHEIILSNQDYKEKQHKEWMEELEKQHKEKLKELEKQHKEKLEKLEELEKLKEQHKEKLEKLEEREKLKEQHKEKLEEKLEEQEKQHKEKLKEQEMEIKRLKLQLEQQQQMVQQMA